MARLALVTLALLSLVALAVSSFTGGEPAPESRADADDSSPAARRSAAGAVELSAPLTETDRVAISSDAEAGSAEDDLVPLTVRVRERLNHAPVPYAVAWVHADELTSLECDADGLAVFDVPPGSVSLGAEPPHRFGPNLLMARPYDPETGEPSAEKRIDVNAGEPLEVALELTRGGAITGRIVNEHGDPMPHIPFLFFEAIRSRWGDSRRVEADEHGAFTLSRLVENWYMLAPHPSQSDAFPAVKIELALGETHDLEIQLAAKRLAQITVECVQEESREPYPLPLAVRFVRADGFADAAEDRSHRRPWTKVSAAPLSFEEVVSPGRYRLMASSYTVWIGTFVLSPGWQETVFIDMDEDLADATIELEVPDVGELATVKGRLTRSIREVGAQLWLDYRVRGGQDLSASLWTRTVNGVETFEVRVDLEYVPDGRLRFVQRGGGEETLLREITVSAGEQNLELTPSLGSNR